MNQRTLVAGACGAAALCGAVAAEEVLVSANISESTTWTADNTYNLQNQIYVLPGASLTIEAGTVVASTPTADGSGSLAVCRGARIYVQGTPDAPVVMTSTADDFVQWRAAANEWGNLTIMGDAYIGDSLTPGNTATPNPANRAAMEGLTADFPGDTKVLYGGGNDDDDSGCISYLSIRYGGRVVGLANELNGLSLGGIGRETDISFVEIMNNVDDGIEIWGGTVGIRYASVWNIGDDSIDVDQGWRGKMQNVLVVQGYSVDASQGSGVGDNGFEMDGAEDSDAQPVTTATIYNATFIGQPAPGAGDGATAWRDNARVQFRNSIFMDCGEKVVRFDNEDGDGSQGYGFNGTLSWADTWTTPWNVTSTVNAPADPGMFYTAQTSGRLIQFTDSVFFRNLDSDAYTEADARGVFDPANDNVRLPNSATSPIVSVTRAAPVVVGGKTMLRVIGLDPRAQGEAATSVSTAPDDGFFTPANYRGAFAPDENWLCGWSAAFQYGMIDTPIDSCGTPLSVACIESPTIPTLIEPAGLIETTTPAYVWTPVTGATWYQLWVNDSTGNRLVEWYTAEEVGAASGICSVVPDVVLNFGEGTWWARAWNAQDGSGPWSAGSDFVVAGAPLTAPVPIGPEGSIAEDMPTYRWEAVSGATWYQLWVNDSTGNRLVKWYTAAEVGAASGECSIAPNVLLNAGDCTWWVRGWNAGEGNGPWSSGTDFSVQGEGLTAPVTIAPTGTISEDMPTYRWEPVSTATWYQLWVNDSTGNRLVKWYTAAEVGAASGECSITPDLVLNPGNGTWWVRAWNAGELNGPWSSGATFNLE